MNHLRLKFIPVGSGGVSIKSRCQDACQSSLEVKYSVHVDDISLLSLQNSLTHNDSPPLQIAKLSYVRSDSLSASLDSVFVKHISMPSAPRMEHENV